MKRTHRQRSLTWRVNKAIENVGATRPVFSRTGPAWMFGLLGVAAELVLAPVVLALTVVVGLSSYLVLDAPWTRIRAQQRPRFVSVRLLYLNTVIVAGFWLAVMFTFSAADPTVSSSVQTRLPALLEVATTSDLRTLVNLKHTTVASRSASSEAIAPVLAASTWFDIFLHGLVCTLAVNFLLYGVVIARRRQRSHHGARSARRKSLRYDSLVGLFVDEDPGTRG
jgi:hypothetical protein